MAVRCASNWAPTILTIDPTLTYSTLVGGTLEDFLTSGNLYFFGFSYGGTFPATAGAFRTTFAGGTSDAVVIKLNPAGTALVWSTLVTNLAAFCNTGFSIAIDPSDNIWFLGVVNGAAGGPPSR